MLFSLAISLFVFSYFLLIFFLLASVLFFLDCRSRTMKNLSSQKCNELLPSTFRNICIDISNENRWNKKSYRNCLSRVNV